ncbi:MAG: WG repeat-containing protein [Armatimonadota bacterium]|nr:WG repeat-containing protein [bacterium]
MLKDTLYVLFLLLMASCFTGCQAEYASHDRKDAAASKCKDKVVGYIDKTGKIVIKPHFRIAGNFFGGLAAVQYSERGQYGYIDKTGKMVIKPKYLLASDFKENLAAVIDPKTKKFGYIDKTGTLNIKPKYAVAKNFSCGLASVTLKNDPPLLFGYIDNTGREIVGMKYGNSLNFSEGLAYVAWGPNKGQSGFIDASGRLVFTLSPELESSRSFFDGMAAVTRRGDDGIARYGFINKAGKTVIRPQFSEVRDFSNGIAAVQYMQENTNIHNVNWQELQKSKSFMWGFVNRTGTFIVSPQFEDAYPFSNGYAAVRVNGRYGFVDSQAKIVIKPQFEFVCNFSDDLAAVLVAGKWGYIDKTGKMVIKPQFTEAGEFHEGLAVVAL